MSGSVHSVFPLVLKDLPLKPYSKSEAADSEDAKKLTNALQKYVHTILTISTAEEVFQQTEVSYQMLQRFNERKGFKKIPAALRDVPAPSSMDGFLPLPRWAAYARQVGITVARVLGVPFAPDPPVHGNAPAHGNGDEEDEDEQEGADERDFRAQVAELAGQVEAIGIAIHVQTGKAQEMLEKEALDTQLVQKLEQVCARVRVLVKSADGADQALKQLLADYEFTSDNPISKQLLRQLARIYVAQRELNAKTVGAKVRLAEAAANSVSVKVFVSLIGMVEAVPVEFVLPKTHNVYAIKEAVCSTLAIQPSEQRLTVETAVGEYLELCDDDATLASINLESSQSTCGQSVVYCSRKKKGTESGGAPSSSLPSSSNTAEIAGNVM